MELNWDLLPVRRIARWMLSLFELNESRDRQDWSYH
jgi:hypothetical protein